MDRSAQCRSSRTSSTGFVSASSVSRPSTAPNSCWRASSRPSPAVGARPVIGQQAAEHRPVRDQLGHPGRGVAGDAAQRVGKRQVRHAVAQLGAAPGQHAEAALPGPPRQLGHQPRLADSRVPADQGDRRFPCGHRIEQAQQPGKLHGTADHGSACVLLHSHDYLIRLGHSPNSAPACRRGPGCTLTGCTRAGPGGSGPARELSKTRDPHYYPVDSSAYRRPAPTSSNPAGGALTWDNAASRPGSSDRALGRVVSNHRVRAMRALTKKQRNALYDHIVTAGLDPARCEFPRRAGRQADPWPDRLSFQRATAQVRGIHGQEKYRRRACGAVFRPGVAVRAELSGHLGAGKRRGVHGCPGPVGQDPP